MLAFLMQSVGVCNRERSKSERRKEGRTENSIELTLSLIDYAAKTPICGRDNFISCNGG